MSGDQAGTGADAAAADAVAFAVAAGAGGSSWPGGAAGVRASPRWPSPWSGMPGRGWATPGAYFPMDGHHLANAQLARLGLENRKGARSPANSSPGGPHLLDRAADGAAGVHDVQPVVADTLPRHHNPPVHPASSPFVRGGSDLRHYVIRMAVDLRAQL